MLCMKLQGRNISSKTVMDAINFNIETRTVHWQGNTFKVYEGKDTLQHNFNKTKKYYLVY